jgi:hypothetical protein
MRRGLFRLWVLVSVCWILAVGAIGVSTTLDEMCITESAGLTGSTASGATAD